MCCGDEAINLVIENWPEFSARYILEPCPPETRLNLLDKLRTYESASACGIAHPRFWRLGPGEGIAEVARTCRFPAILKPRLSQHSRLIGSKYLRADNAEELKHQYERCAALNIAIVAMEFIPGTDDRYCSYYTYIDDAGIPLFHFTKRILRRHPENQGGSTYHITDWNPEVADRGLRLFKHVGLRGLGNVEFKRDPRDSELKLIEINARYTAGNAVVTLSGIDQALLSYSQLTGWTYEAPRSYREGLVMWDPVPDYLAFRALRLRGEITLVQWLRQVIRTDTTPLYDLRDPLPGLHHLATTAIAAVRHLGRRWSRRHSTGAAPSSMVPIKR
jgi:predicted ATP-grasp superfamily ATP-dependent carboligase